jgi:hypothetical protein
MSKSSRLFAKMEKDVISSLFSDLVRPFPSFSIGNEQACNKLAHAMSSAVAGSFFRLKLRIFLK